MKDLIILGAGGDARQLYFALRNNKTYNVIGFLDETIQDDIYLYDKIVTNDINNIIDKNKPEPYLICAVLDCALKERWAKEYSSFKFATIIDPTALVEDSVKVGEGTVIQTYTIIGSGSIIGKHVKIGCGCMSPHDTVIGNFSSVSMAVNLAGWSTIGKKVFLGAGSTVIPKIKIADGCIIGAGAVVTKNTEKGKTYIGVPARILKK